MIQKALEKLGFRKKASASYAEVLNRADTSEVVRLLKKAAKKANADQRELVESVK